MTQSGEAKPGDTVQFKGRRGKLVIGGAGAGRAKKKYRNRRGDPLKPKRRAPVERRAARNPSRPAIPPITSIGDLRFRAGNEPAYRKLAFTASSNLGENIKDDGTPESLSRAIRWLETNAMETDERGVVDEINFVRGLV